MPNESSSPERLLLSVGEGCHLCDSTRRQLLCAEAVERMLLERVAKEMCDGH